MIRWSFVPLAAALLCVLPRPVQAATGVEAGPVMRAMHDELERTMARLALADSPRPYYVAYSLFDVDQSTVTASSGAVEVQRDRHSRLARIDLRVGDPSFDNTNFAGDVSSVMQGFVPGEISEDDDYDAVRHDLWLATDTAYKNAVVALERKRTARATAAWNDDGRGDFTSEQPARIVLPDIETPPASGSAALAAELSAILYTSPIVQADRVVLKRSVLRRSFLSSEGSATFEPAIVWHLEATCRTQSDDGMVVKHFFTADSTAPGGFLDRQSLHATAHRIVHELEAIRSAPRIDEYAGPVLFEGVAAAQVARVLLARNLSGTPPPRGLRPGRASLWESAFAHRLGRRILPAGFDVTDDPTRESWGHTPLLGFYHADSEGMPARRVRLVTNGILKEFVQSRTPSATSRHSNGHGRGGPIGPIRGVIGNLIVSSRAGLTQQALRARFLEEVRAEGLPAGLIVRLLDESRITGPGGVGRGRNHSRGGDAVILPPPLIVVRVGLDGKEEFVRGLSFESLSLRALRHIIAAGRRGTVHSSVRATGLVARHSSNPVGVSSSVIAPDLLFEEVGLKGATGPQPKRPLLPRRAGG